MTEDIEKNNFSDIPVDAWEILKGVNLFCGENITPEPSVEPMICSPDIPLTKCELAFLMKGPRFMLRQETSE